MELGSRACYNFTYHRTRCSREARGVTPLPSCFASQVGVWSARGRDCTRRRLSPMSCSTKSGPAVTLGSAVRKLRRTMVGGALASSSGCFHMGRA
eukprot:1192468-Prorocentrum_minimum.AAC.2